MEDVKSYVLQIQRNEEWQELVKSYEYESLVHASIERTKKGDICRVIDTTGSILWQTKSAPSQRDTSVK